MAQQSGHVVMQTPAPYMGDPFLSASAGKILMIDFKKLSHKKYFIFIKGGLLSKNLLKRSYLSRN